MKYKVFAATLLLTATVAATTLAEEPKAVAGPINVNLLGEVNKPSRYVMPMGSNVLDLVATGGDVKPTADLTGVLILHTAQHGGNIITTVDLKATLQGKLYASELAEGDTLYIPAKPAPKVSIAN